MQVNGELSRRKRTKPFRLRWLVYSFILAVLITSVIISFLYYYQESPNQTQVHPFPEPRQLEGGSATLFPLIYQGELLEEWILVEDSELHLPYSLIKRKIDPYIFWDEPSEAVIITNEEQVFTLRNQFLHEQLKDEQVELQFPVKQVEGEIYIPFSPLAAIYPFELKKHEPFSVVELIDPSSTRLLGEVIEPVEDKEEAIHIRTEPTYQAPFVQVLAGGEKLSIFTERNNWYFVQSNEGALGYLPKDKVRLEGLSSASPEISSNDGEVEEAFVAWKPLGGKINLTWEHVVSRSPNPDTITPPKGVNVVSPTWFHLQDEDGTLRNLADKRYVDWAHQNGFQVWALITNDFNPDRTHAVLSHYNKRRELILQLVHYAEIYDLDGINIDFENVYLKDKENLVQFVRELTPYLHEQGLVVSIDVTIKSTSEMWSMFLDRKALAETVDYVMVMTYDEHWASSPVAGSVASLPWVERGLRGVLEEVPAHKLILGIPFYTRLWKEEVDEHGQIKVSSRAFSMSAIENWMNERGVTASLDERTGQHYAEYTDPIEGATYKIWLEDEHSVAQRVELVHKYNLAGIASWRRGFEKPVIWDVIDAGLKKVH